MSAALGGLAGIVWASYGGQGDPHRRLNSRCSWDSFDGVIDFAKAVQDRFNPLYINPAYNSGDNLHPNDAGYEAMADAINLAPLTS